jgi:integrase
LKIWKSFEGNNAYKIQDVSNEILDQFTTFMTSKDYASNTTKRQIARAKFFISRAKTEGIKTDPTYQDRVFVEKDQEEIDHPYLNEKEIDSVYDLDLSNDLSLDNIRDNAIIGLWTGLRISDFNKNLDISNIDGDYIRIKTQKTGAWVTIPLHPQVREVIKKRHGNLPVKTSDKHFNEQIKVICMLAEIDQQIKGGVIVVDEKTKEKRKVYGLHKKYKLVSSHICRRSFASNLFGHISNRDLMNICGWAKEDMMLRYIKKTKTESADELKKYWNTKYE